MVVFSEHSSPSPVASGLLRSRGGKCLSQGWVLCGVLGALLVVVVVITCVVILSVHSLVNDGGGISASLGVARGRETQVVGSQMRLRRRLAVAQLNQLSTRFNASVAVPPTTWRRFWVLGAQTVRFPDQKTQIAELATGKYRLTTLADFSGESTGVTPEGAVWSRLRDASPRLMYIHGTLNDEECQSIIAVARKDLQRSKVNTAVGGSLKSEVRTSKGMFLTTPEQVSLPANIRLRSRIASVMGLPDDFIESTQVLEYEPGQFYKPHMDVFRPTNLIALNRGGQRIATAITWLNELPVGGGGESVFPAAKPSPIEIPPQLGDTVIFYSLQEDFITVDPASLHGGSPPSPGHKKYVAVTWAHARKFV